MGLELKGDELNLLVLTASSALSAWFDELESLRSNFEAFTESDSIKGQAADSMKTYIDEVHISCLLPLIENLLNDFSSKLSVYDYKYSEIDGDCHKHLNEDAIGSAKEDYRSDGIRDCEDEFGQVLGSISDIVEISNPDPDDIGNDCARIRFRLEKLGNEIVQHENETRSSGTAPLEELISSVSELVRSAVSRPSSTLTSYQTGDLIQLSGLEEAYENTLSSVSYNENNSGTIEAARQYESNMMEQLQEEEAAREQENRITGILEVIGAGITIAIGVAAIVTTMGAAAPLVVGAEEAILDITLATSGITSCLMGASDIIEGIGTVVTGKGYNIGRDFLFGGDSGTYNTVETAATTAALILNPIASAVKAGESLSVKVVATSIGRYEIANASCIINSKLADGIGATFNLDETQTQVIELGLNVIENTALKRKTGITEQSGESSGSKISSSSASEEQLKINADTARKDLNLRTQAAVENNNSQLYETSYAQSSLKAI